MRARGFNQKPRYKGHSHYKKSRCFTLRVLITPKTCDVSSDEKIAKFLEELRMPSLLVQPQYGTFNPTGAAQMQIYSILRTAILCIRNSDTAARTFNVALHRKSGCGSHVSKITIFLLCAFSSQNTLQSFARS